MRATVFGLLAFALVGPSYGQPLDLRGRVVDANGVAIREAVVELKVRGAATKTAVDGSFTLDANTSVGPGAAGSIPLLDLHLASGGGGACTGTDSQVGYPP